MFRRKTRRSFTPVSPAEMDRRFTAGLALTGDTYPKKEAIRRLGGEWDKVRRVWLMPDAQKQREAQAVVNGETIIDASAQVVEVKPKRDGWKDSWPQRLCKLDDEECRFDIPVDDALENAISGALKDVGVESPSYASTPPDTDVVHYSELTDKRFEVGLDNTEKTELASVESRLDEKDATFYAPVIAALNKALDEAKKEIPMQAIFEGTRAWFEREAEKLEKFAADAAEFARQQIRLANEQPTVAHEYKKKADRSTERAMLYQARATETRERARKAPL